MEGRELSSWKNQDFINGTTSISAWAANVLKQSSNARKQYNQQASLLTEKTQENKIKRFELKEKIREITPQPIRQVVENARPIENEKAKLNDNAINNPSKTNEIVNAKADNFSKGSKILTGIAAVGSVYNISTAASPIKQTAIESGIWAGAVTGGTIFAEGSSFTGHPIIIGGAGLVGSILGGILGEKGIKSIIEKDPKDHLINWDAGVCFIKGTKISMSNNKLKLIEEVLVGDSVKTYNLEKKIVENKLVMMTESSFEQNLVEIILDNNIKNINTIDHPYYVIGKGWCSVNPKETKKRHKLKCEKLEVNDKVYVINSLNKLEITIIKSLIEKTQKTITYNLSNVSDNHNYFANGVLVHNKRLNKE